MERSYYTPRQGQAYYQTVRDLLQGMGPQESLLDVGCFDTPVSTWGEFQRRSAVNLTDCPRYEGVQYHIGDYLRMQLPRHSVITCLQVIEHFTDAVVAQWADKLLSGADTVIVSVPFQWPAGQEEGHIQDPIDEFKFLQMMGNPPHSTLTLTGSRLVGVFPGKALWG